MRCSYLLCNTPSVPDLYSSTLLHDPQNNNTPAIASTTSTPHTQPLSLPQSLSRPYSQLGPRRNPGSASLAFLDSCPQAPNLICLFSAKPTHRYLTLGGRGTYCIQSRQSTTGTTSSFPSRPRDQTPHSVRAARCKTAYSRVLIYMHFTYFAYEYAAWAWLACMRLA
jgi:hypothetical protein